MNFNYAIFTVLKEVILKNSNPFEFFPYLTPLKKYIYKIYTFFNSAHNILDIFAHILTTQIDVEWAIIKKN